MRACFFLFLFCLQEYRGEEERGSRKESPYFCKFLSWQILPVPLPPPIRFTHILSQDLHTKKEEEEEIRQENESFPPPPHMLSGGKRGKRREIGGGGPAGGIHPIRKTFSHFSRPPPPPPPLPFSCTHAIRRRRGIPQQIIKRYHTHKTLTLFSACGCENCFPSMCLAMSSISRQHSLTISHLSTGFFSSFGANEGRRKEGEEQEQGSKEKFSPERNSSSAHDDEEEDEEEEEDAVACEVGGGGRKHDTM